MKKGSKMGPQAKIKKKNQTFINKNKPKKK